ncbi:type IV pilus assembly protein PilM [Deferribacterales bacterium RsTz2092]|nr:pilus assembly protein PilM [Deferribacterales bacterium]
MSKHVGLNFGARFFKVVELGGKGGTAEIVSAQFIPVQNGAFADGQIMDFAATSELVAKAYSTGSFSSKPSALALRSGIVVAGVKVPFINETQLRNNLLFIADQYLNINLGEYSVDYNIVRIDKTALTANVVFVANRKDTISDYVSIFNSANVNLGIISDESIALCNLYVRMQLPMKEPTIILQTGASETCVIFLENGTFARRDRCNIGGDFCNSLLANDASIPKDEIELAKTNLGNHKSAESVKKIIETEYLPKLLDEVDKSMQTYVALGGRAPKRVYLSGGGATTHRLSNAIKDRFGLVAEVMNPISSIKSSDSETTNILQQMPAVLNVAIAMALR